MRKSRHQLAMGSVILLGLLALLQHWLGSRRPVRPELRAAKEFLVTSSTDRGVGSLREAIFHADSSHERARILIQAHKVALQTPMPPLVNPLGVVIEADPLGAEIDAQPLGVGPVFDVDAPNSVVSGVHIVKAPGPAILVRKDGFRLLNSKFANGDEGLHALEDVRDLVIEKNTFQNNRVGVWLTPPETGVIVRDNRFYGHKDGAVWAVGASWIVVQQGQTLELRRNYFENDRNSLVLANTPVLVEGNEFVGSREEALYLSGQGAVVRGNRIRGGGGIGISAEGTQGTVIEANEIDHNRALGILIRSSHSGLIEKNRMYDNGYGIAFVFGGPANPNIANDNALLEQQFDGIIVIGGSPVIKNNQALNSRLAGLRILDFIPLSGERLPSNPFLANNTFNGNKLNEPVRGEYRVRAREKPL